MLENMNDVLSLIVLGLITLYGFYCMFAVLDKHHAERMRILEEQSLYFYDELEDSDDDNDEPYYE